MHLLVIGGTGPTGLVFIDAALQAGHRLTLFARSPSKFPQHIHDHSDVTIVKGEFTDLDAVRRALALGAEILVSFAGPALPNSGTAVTEFYEKLFPLLLTDSSIKRCMILSTASYQVPEDKPGVKWFIAIRSIRAFGGSTYAEINGMSRATASIPLDKIEWTLFRVPTLTNGKAAAVHAGYLGDGGDGFRLSRKSIAVWVLQELDDRKWIGKAPALSQVGWL